MNVEHFQGVQHIFGEDTALKDIVFRTAEVDLYDKDLIPKFCSSYRNWILSSDLNNFAGLDNFNSLSYSNGTTESFDKFRIRHRNKRLKVLRDEYLYHKLFLGAEDIVGLESLRSGDAVIISAPYVKTGEIHPLMNNILDVCDRLEIPVLIDCAYYGLCANLSFNFDHPCIEDIAFSLSKVFGTSYYRIGVRFSKDQDDSLSNFGREGYVNRLGAAIGAQLLDRFSPDYLFSTYRETQIRFCKHLNILPSNSVIFGIDINNFFNLNPRADERGRFCFSKYLASGILPQ